MLLRTDKQTLARASLQIWSDLLSNRPTYQKKSSTLSISIFTSLMTYSDVKYGEYNDFQIMSDSLQAIRIILIFMPLRLGLPGA